MDVIGNNIPSPEVLAALSDDVFRPTHLNVNVPSLPVSPKVARI